MIEPVLKDSDFLADVSAANRPGDGFRLRWLGQSGFLVQWRGGHLLLDPYLSDSLTAKYANMDKPHVRMTARVVDPSRLDFIDVVSASHAHTDHLDPETLIPLLRANSRLALVVPESMRDLAAERLAVPVSALNGLNEGDCICIAGFRFTAVASADEDIERDATGRRRCLGYVVQSGPWTVYRSGDTVLYEGMAGRLRRFSIDVALLPINGQSPERRLAGNLSVAEAAWLAHQIGARIAIPRHYEMFGFNTARPEDFLHAAQQQQVCHLLRCAQKWNGRQLLRSWSAAAPHVRGSFSLAADGAFSSRNSVVRHSS